MRCLAFSFSSRRGEGKAKMAGKRCKGTPLKVFSGNQAKLNRIVMLLYRASKTPLTEYMMPTNRSTTSKATSPMTQKQSIGG